MNAPSDITPLSFLDYPQKAACIFWFRGCNLRCPYCYNKELLYAEKSIYPDYHTFLEERKGFLDAVVLSGGESTLNPDIIILCEEIKSMGYLIKIDTNGSNPECLFSLLEKKLIDYVAIDHKAPSAKSPFLPEGIPLFTQFKKSLTLLLNFSIPHEVRTTCHPNLLSEKDILLMAKEIQHIGYTGTYYLQHYFHTQNTLGNLPRASRRYNRPLLDTHSPLLLKYRNFPEEQYQ